MSPKSDSVSGKIQKSVHIPAHGEKTIHHTIQLKAPMLWSPKQPNLYTAKIVVFKGKEKLDQYSVPLGLRSISYNADEGFLLNHQPLDLNGACVHHDNGPLGAASYDRAEFRKAKLLKEAGFNAVRTAHNPPSEAFLYACDAVGLLVIDESFDGWRVGKNKYDYSSLYFDKWWRKDIKSMVLRDRNHPSIIIWSDGNEIIERKKPEAIVTAKKLTNLIHRLDPTRPVTSAMTTWDQSWEIYDPLFNVFDIAGYNYQMFRAESDHKRVPSRVIMQTESYPRNAFSNWKAVKDHPYIIGDFVWTGLDYLGESGIGRYYYEGETPGEHYERGMYPWHGAYCGDIDLIGHRKPISHYREMLYHPEKKLYLAVKEPDGYYGEIKETRWSVWPTWESWNWQGWEGKDIVAEVYSRYPKVRLYLNGKRIGEKKTGLQEEFKADFTLLYQPGVLKVVGVVNGKEVGGKKLVTAGAPEKIQLTADRMKLSPTGQDLSYVSIAITDKNGVINPNSENRLHFTLSGPGEIVAVANANMKDNDPYTGTTRKAWKDNALVIIKAGHKEGKIRLKVTSERLKTDILNLYVNKDKLH